MSQKSNQIPSFVGCSHYSSYGASSVSDIVNKFKSLGLSGGCLAEFDNLNSAMEFYATAKKAKITPVVGVQISLPDNWSVVEYDKKNNPVPQFLVLTVQFLNEESYRAYCKLTEKTIERNPTHFLEWDELFAMKDSVVVGSGGMEGLGKFIISGNSAAFKSCLSFLTQNLKDIYLELRPFESTYRWVPEMLDFSKTKVLREGYYEENEPIFGTSDYQLAVNKAYWALRISGQKYIISSAFHYCDEEHAPAQIVRLENLKLPRAGDKRYIKDFDQTKRYFTESMGIDESSFESLVQSNIEWLNKFKDFKLTTNSERWVLPELDQDSLAWVRAEIDRVGRMDWSDPAMVERLKTEIKTLKYNGKIDILPYFEPIVDLKKWCDANGVINNLRGSAGGSLLIYLMGISGVNPLKHGLSFERFINEGRIIGNTMTDVDMDIGNRDAAVEYLKNKYGNRMVQLSVDVKTKIKTAIKDCERAILGAVRKETEDICTALPNPPQGADEYDFVFGYTDDDGNYQKGLLEITPALQEYQERNPEIWASIVQTLGTLKNKGAHACGIVIAPNPISDYIPLTSVSGSPVTGFSPKSLETSGLIKYDILGVNTLLDIGECLKLIEQRTGEKLDPYSLPDDEEVYKQFHLGNTETVFQFNTQAVIPYLAEIKPMSRDDLSTVTALVRPGALDAPSDDGRTMAQVYVARRKGEVVKYIHPDLEPILKDTSAVIVFQEQIIRIFKEIGGFSAVQAEDARRAVGKKDEKLLRETLNKLDEPCRARGWSDSQINQLKQQISASGRYSFNASHSTSYAYIGYACQYLKTKFPLEWWTAVLKNSSKTELPKFWPHCGHFVDLPDINLSGEGFEIQGDKIRAPISIINGIGDAAYHQLVEGRPYKDLEDFVIKSKKGGKAVHKGVVVKLIAAGLLDSLYENKDLDIEDKIYEYFKVKAKVEGIKKIEEVPEEYRKLREIDQFLLKKELMPVISTDLRRFVLSAKGLTPPQKKHLPWRNRSSMWIDGVQLEYFRAAMEKDDTFEGRMGCELKTISYIIEESTKTYANKSKQMTKILLDTNGLFGENVVWPPFGENVAPTGFKNQIAEITWKFNKKRNELTIKKIEKIKVR